MELISKVGDKRGEVLGKKVGEESPRGKSKKKGRGFGGKARLGEDALPSAAREHGLATVRFHGEIDLKREGAHRKRGKMKGTA